MADEQQTNGNGEAMETAPPSAAEKAAARQAEVDAATEEQAVAVEAARGLESSDLMPFSPQTYRQGWHLANVLSKSGIVADGLKGNPGAVLAVIDFAAGFGIRWGLAVQRAHVVKGRIGWPADLLAAIVERSPAFEYFEVVEADNEHATVEAKRHRWPAPRRYTVTIEDAKHMGFLDGRHSQLWSSKRPMPMLVAMARREAARLWDPVGCAGLYEVDELRSLPEPAPVAKISGGELAAASPAALPAAELVVDATPSVAPAAEPKPTSGAGLPAALILELRKLAMRSRVSETRLERSLGCKLEEGKVPDGTPLTEEIVRAAIERLAKEVS